MLKLENIIKDVIKKIKNLNNVESNDVIYMYDAMTDEFNIIHNFQRRIDEDDIFAVELATILSENLFENGHYDVNIYEDKNTLEKFTLSTNMYSRTTNNWYHKSTNGFTTHSKTEIGTAA